MNYRDCHLVLFDFRNKITPIPDIEKPITNKIIRDIKSTVPKFICVFNILLKNKSVIIKLPSVLAPKIAIANPKKIKINEIVSFFFFNHSFSSIKCNSNPVFHTQMGFLHLLTYNTVSH